jgi:hypothetical protein
VRDPDSDGPACTQTALFFAVRVGDVRVVQRLVEAGADPMIGDKWEKVRACPDRRPPRGTAGLDPAFHRCRAYSTTRFSRAGCQSARPSAERAVWSSFVDHISRVRSVKFLVEWAIGQNRVLELMSQMGLYGEVGGARTPITRLAYPPRTALLRNSCRTR